jgi:L-amino acid N-acyltransferase YncA
VVIVLFLRIYFIWMELIYKNATIKDLDKIVEIYNSTVASRIVTADTEPVTVESKLKWFNEHSPEKRPLWIVVLNNETIGWVSFQSFYGRPAYNATVEVSIYLHEQYRGKGFGKMILKYCIDHCADYGINTLLGFIFAHNEPSLQLFKSFGFENWATLPNIAVLDGIERSLIIVGKRI